MAPSRGRHGNAGIVERTAARMPGNGEHQPLESNGWCRPHDEPTCEPAWPRGVPAIRALSARVMVQSERLRPQRCGRGLETPSSNRQVKGRWCVAFRSSKGCDNHRTHASSQVPTHIGLKLTENQIPKTPRCVRRDERNSSILQPSWQWRRPRAASPEASV